MSVIVGRNESWCECDYFDPKTFEKCRKKSPEVHDQQKVSDVARKAGWLCPYSNMKTYCPEHGWK